MAHMCPGVGARSSSATFCRRISGSMDWIKKYATSISGGPALPQNDRFSRKISPKMGPKWVAEWVEIAPDSIEIKDEALQLARGLLLEEQIICAHIRVAECREPAPQKQCDLDQSSSGMHSQITKM